MSADIYKHITSMIAQVYIMMAQVYSMMAKALFEEQAAATGNPAPQAIYRWTSVPLGTLGTQAVTGNPGTQAIGSGV